MWVSHAPTSSSIALSTSSSRVTFLFPSFFGFGSFPSLRSRQTVMFEQPPSFSLTRLRQLFRRWEDLDCKRCECLTSSARVRSPCSLLEGCDRRQGRIVIFMPTRVYRMMGVWTAPGLLDTRVRVFDLMRPPQLERVFPALPGPAFGSRSPRESNDGYTGS